MDIWRAEVKDGSVINPKKIFEGKTLTAVAQKDGMKFDVLNKIEELDEEYKLKTLKDFPLVADDRKEEEIQEAYGQLSKLECASISDKRRSVEIVFEARRKRESILDETDMTFDEEERDQRRIIQNTEDIIYLIYDYTIIEDNGFSLALRGDVLFDYPLEKVIGEGDTFVSEKFGNEELQLKSGLDFIEVPSLRNGNYLEFELEEENGDVITGTGRILLSEDKINNHDWIMCANETPFKTYEISEVIDSTRFRIKKDHREIRIGDELWNVAKKRIVRKQNDIVEVDQPFFSIPKTLTLFPVSKAYWDEREVLDYIVQGNMIRIMLYERLRRGEVSRVRYDRLYQEADGIAIIEIDEEFEGIEQGDWIRGDRGTLGFVTYVEAYENKYQVPTGEIDDDGEPVLEEKIDKYTRIYHRIIRGDQNILDKNELAPFYGDRVPTVTNARTKYLDFIKAPSLSGADIRVDLRVVGSPTIETPSDMIKKIIGEDIFEDSFDLSTRLRDYRLSYVIDSSKKKREIINDMNDSCLGILRLNDSTPEKFLYHHQIFEIRRDQSTKVVDEINLFNLKIRGIPARFNSIEYTYRNDAVKETATGLDLALERIKSESLRLHIWNGDKARRVAERRLLYFSGNSVEIEFVTDINAELGETIGLRHRTLTDKYGLGIIFGVVTSVEELEGMRRLKINTVSDRATEVLCWTSSKDDATKENIAKLSHITNNKLSPIDDEQFTGIGVIG